MKTKETSKYQRNKFFKKRRNLRLAVLLTTLEDLEPKHPKGVPTLEIYHESFNNGYSYNYKTLHQDLETLEKRNIILSKVVHLGRGWGTKKLWNINHENDYLKKEKQNENK